MKHDLTPVIKTLEEAIKKLENLKEPKEPVEKLEPLKRDPEETNEIWLVYFGLGEIHQWSNLLDAIKDQNEFTKREIKSEIVHYREVIE